MLFFADAGFSMAKFMRARIGPVIMNDHIEYFKEVALLDQITVNLALQGLSADGSCFLMRNEIVRSDGKLAARITSPGGWLDLGTRKLIAASAGLLTVLQQLGRAEDFKELSGSLK